MMKAVENLRVPQAEPDSYEEMTELIKNIPDDLYK